MSLTVKLNCPLGSKCEEARDGEIHRCAWYTKLAGTNPQTGEKMDEYACAIAWGPILSIENSAQQKRTSEEVEALRNQLNETNQRLIPLLMMAMPPPGTVQILPTGEKERGI